MVDGLSRRQFEVLRSLNERPGQTQRGLAKSLGFGLGTVNAVVRECEAAGLVDSGSLTEAGRLALEPFRVAGAVIMAAGLSQRFAPISYEKPKGALVVRGEGLVERQIRQLREAGVHDIVLVVGYKMEYFFELADRLGVSLVVNDEYATRNNNGSLWLVREDLGNRYVCSSDNYFTQNPFNKYEYSSFYATQWVEGETEEWVVETGPGGLIRGVQVGGEDSLILLGHAYFDRRFACEFRAVLEEVYDRPETAPLLWEEIWAENLDQLPMVAERFEAGVVNEFDSLDELIEFDEDFIENVDSSIFDNISKSLGVSKASIGGFSPLKQGLTNLSSRFEVGGQSYVYRHPGPGTEKMMDRHAEKAAILLSQQLGLDSTYLYMDAEEGWKISRFVEGSRNAYFSDPDHLRRAMEMSRALHDSGAHIERVFDFMAEAEKYEQVLLEHGPIDVPGYHALKSKVVKLKEFADAEGFPLVPSHNDFFHLNFLIDEQDGMHLIDWEYAGMSDQANDYGTLVVCSQLTDSQAHDALVYYFGRQPTPTEERHFNAYQVFAGWAWYVWSLAKEAEGDHVGEWKHIYYQAASSNIDKMLQDYQTSNTEETTKAP